MPLDNMLKSQVSQSYESKTATSPFDDQVNDFDFGIQSLHYDMMTERDIKEESLTLNERIVLTTKFIYQLQSHELCCESKDVFAEKAAKFFEKKDIKEWSECPRRLGVFLTRRSS